MSTCSWRFSGVSFPVHPRGSDIAQRQSREARWCTHQLQIATLCPGACCFCRYIVSRGCAAPETQGSLAETSRDGVTRQAGKATI